MGNNEMMLGVHGTLHIVTDYPAASATRGHRARIGISQRDLLIFGLHHLGVQLVLGAVSLGAAPQSSR
jgi:hypothetical protein